MKPVSLLFSLLCVHVVVEGVTETAPKAKGKAKAGKKKATQQ